MLVDQISEGVRRRLRVRQKAVGQIPPDLLAQFIASTFVLVLNWWIENGCQLHAKEVNRSFRSLVLPALALISE
jgi:hypothetical protein